MKPVKRPQQSKKQPSSAKSQRPSGGRGAAAERPANGRRRGDEQPSAGRKFNTDRHEGARKRNEERPAAGRKFNAERSENTRKPFQSSARREAPARSAAKPLINDKFARAAAPATAQRQFHVWGRRPVENYLTRLQQEESLDQRSYALHVIADKAGKVPSHLRNIIEPCKNLGLKITLCKSQDDEEWPLNSEEQLNHQRVCLRVPSIPTVSIHDVAQSLPDMIAETPHGCLGLVLDQVQDPRNFGAILRTAAFFGVKFVVFGEDRQAEITPLVVKTSSGGAFSVQLVPTVNINRALEMLKKSGVWIVGSSLQASARHDELPLDRHYVLVVGNESKGMRQEVARHCDYLVKIPGGVAAVDSLNVGVATGVLLSTLQSEISRASMQLSQTAENTGE
ncbi:MAG: hypothetical protein RLZZ488_340 [Pseudomonadota bacterium]|jgi:predicted rRNA methylase